MLSLKVQSPDGFLDDPRRGLLVRLDFPRSQGQCHRVSLGATAHSLTSFQQNGVDYQANGEAGRRFAAEE